MIKDRSEISRLFTEMQNDIARNFKDYIISVWNNCESMSQFQSVMRLAAKYHVDPDVNDRDDLLSLAIVDGMDYREYMERYVFEHSQYNDADMIDQVDDWGDFDFSSMNEAFNKYIDKAMAQFGAGKNIDEKIFRQLAIISITQEYKQNKIKLTLRQLYYQMVSKNYIKNKEQEYKRIIDLTGNMREACVLELDEFADNTRFAVRYDYEDDPKDFIFKRLEENKYFRDSREHQPHYLEVWIEKEALRTVVKPITDRWDIPLFICRGYPSTSSLYDQASAIFDKTMDGRTAEDFQSVTILYFGDHDPSGLQIPEAIERIFHTDYQMQHVSVEPCGLTMAQIRQYNLPPNPAKMTDPRAEKYMQQHGDESWELDALPPLELQKIVGQEISARTDMDLWQESRDRQAKEREKIAIVKQYVRRNWSKITEGSE